MMNGFFYRFFLSPLRTTYRKILRPKTRGVKVIIQHRDEVLLIKNTYGARDKWNLPGGGVKRKEALSLAAKREIREELHIKLTDLKKLGSFLNTKEYAKDTVTVFLSKVENKNLKLNKKEIKEAKWFPKKDLKNLADKFSTLEEALKLAKYS